MAEHIPLHPSGWELHPLPGGVRITRARKDRQSDWLRGCIWALTTGLLAVGLHNWAPPSLPGLKAISFILGLQAGVAALFVMVSMLVREEWDARAGSLTLRWRALGLTWTRRYTGRLMSFALQFGSTGGRVDTARPLYELFLRNGRQRERVLVSIRIDGNPEAPIIAHSLGAILAEATGWPFDAPAPSQPRPIIARL